LLTRFQVLDLANEKASFCSKLLADLGAEVIKVERPGGGASRGVGPFWKNIPHPENSLSFWYNNTSKFGITLDLEAREGQEIFRQLASKADVMIETFPPGYLERLDLDYESLSKINPRLILASVTDFGQTGPYRQYKSCDIVASATGGQMYVCGAPDTSPLKPYGEQSYYMASLLAAIGILIALRERNHSGEGQHIDISLQEAVAATLEHVLVRYFYDGVVSKRQGNSHQNDSFYILPCKDGYILLLVNRDWDILVNWLDSEGMAGDLKEERWRNEEYRGQHFDYLVGILTHWTKTHTEAELFELGQLMHLPLAPVCTLEEMVNSAQLLARKFFVSVEHPELATHFSYPGAPYKFSCSSWNTKRAPLIGEHNFALRAKGGGINCNLNQIDFAPQETKINNSNLQQSCKKEGYLIYSKLDSPERRNFAALPQNALDGLRILDFTWLLAGPYATRILADFGAEVIKVQSRKTATGAESNTTGYFNTWNRNKLGITLNMNHPKARDIALRLVKISDVVIENFTPRVMSNWELSYDDLKEVKPDTIMLSMSAMGQTGPWKDFAALGSTIQAFSSVTYLTSFPSKIASPSARNDKEKIAESPPSGLGYSYADPVAGLFAALAILAALEYRDKTGQGQYIDISEYEAMCSLLGPAILDYTVKHNAATPQGNGPGHILAAPYGCYKCSGKDRWCVIAVFTEEEWKALKRVLGYPAWSKEKRFATYQERKRHIEELDGLLEQWTIKHTPKEVMNLLQQAGIPAGMVEDAKDLATDPHLIARNFFVQAEHPVLGETFSDNTPIKLSHTPARFCQAAPLLGQDNLYVYRDILGMDEQEILKYIEAGVIS